VFADADYPTELVVENLWAFPTRCRVVLSYAVNELLQVALWATPLSSPLTVRVEGGRESNHGDKMPGGRTVPTDAIVRRVSTHAATPDCRRNLAETARTAC